MTLEEFCSKKLLTHGENSECYLIGKEKVLKIFKRPLDKECVEKFKYFLNYKNDSFIFPDDFIVYGDQFLGYVTLRSKGVELEKIFNNFDFINYSNLSKKLEEDIDYLSTGKIVINDISTRNILCEPNLLKVIDPDFYKIHYKESVDKVKIYNAETYKYFITNLFILPYLKIGKKPDKYIVDKINTYIKSNMNVSELIIKLKYDLENYYNEEINNIKTFTKVLRR